MGPVLLINPPVFNKKAWVREGRCQQAAIWGVSFPPFSLALIARQLKNINIESDILDAAAEKLELENVLDTVIKLQPTAAIISISTPTVESELNWFIPALKKALPQIKTISIGAHTTSLPKESLAACPDLDFIILGEPETVITKLFAVESWSEKNLRTVQGIAFRSDSGEIQVNPMPAPLENLDSLGFPYWEKINFKNYQLPIVGKPFSMLHFARGCPYHCSYCVAHVYGGRKFRKRSVESLIKEIEYNLSLGIYNFLFWTELATGDPTYLSDFCNSLIKSGLHKKIRWVCNSRTDSVTPDLLKLMKTAGCWQIAFGFEFGSDRLLRHTKKGGKASVEQSIKAARWAYEADLTVDGHFMIGYPGESFEEMQQTIDLALTLPLTFSHFYSVVPYPGTELYETWQAERLKLGDKAATSWQNFDQQNTVFVTTSVSPKKIQYLKQSAYRRFYLRPIIFKRVLFIPRRLSEVLNLFLVSIRVIRGLLFH